MSENVRFIAVSEYKIDKSQSLFRDLLYAGGKKLIQKSIKRRIDTSMTIIKNYLNSSFEEKGIKCIEAILMYKKNLILLKVHDKFFHPSLIHYTRHKKSGLPVWDMRVMAATFCEEELEKISKCIKKSEVLFSKLIKESECSSEASSAKQLRDLY